MATSGPVAESSIECAVRLANDAVERGLIGGYAVAGAFAFIYYGEPFEARGLDLMMKLSLTQGGLVDVGPVFWHFVDGGASPRDSSFDCHASWWTSSRPRMRSTTKR